MLLSVWEAQSQYPKKEKKIPCYNSKNATILQEKFGELVKLSVISRPEDVNTEVVDTSLSFLVKKAKWITPIGYQFRRAE